MDVLVAVGLVLIILVLAALAYRVSNSKIDSPVTAAPVAQPAPLVPAEKRTTQICPWCKSEVPADAIACKNCGKELRKSMIMAGNLQTIGCSLTIIGLLILGSLCLISGGFGF